MTIYNADGKPFSQWRPSDKFAHVWEVEGFPDSDLEREYVFDPQRKWRFDYASPSLKIAIEVDGFGFGHQSIKKLIGQYEKQNKAVQMGWKILRYNSSHLGSYEKCQNAVSQVMEVMLGNHD